MRAVIQRVGQAQVLVDGKSVAGILRGVCVLVGLHRDDTDDDAEYIVRKILNLRIFESEVKKWDKSVTDLGLEVLLVSQFTLYGKVQGNKLDFHNALAPTEAATRYESLVERVRKSYVPDKVKNGVFGALMQVDIQNDGPVTVCLDSRSRDQ